MNEKSIAPARVFIFPINLELCLLSSSLIISFKDSTYYNNYIYINNNKIIRPFFFCLKNFLLYTFGILHSCPLMVTLSPMISSHLAINLSTFLM